MQTITAKTMPATDTQPTRVQAKTSSGIKIIQSWDHSLEGMDNHVKAAKVLAEKLKWHGEWRGGTNADGTTTFVCLEGGPTFTVAKEG